MIEHKEIMSAADSVGEKLGEKMGLSKGPLNKRLKRAGRRLPKQVHRDGALIIRAQDLAGHPKLLRQVTPAEISTAQERIISHLDQIDPIELRKDRWLSLTAALAFNLLAVGALLILVLRWRGFV